MEKRKSISRLAYALGYSWQGLTAAWRHEAAFKQEALLLLAGVIAAFYLPFTAWVRVALLGSLVMVMVVELLNSAIEAVVDRVSAEHHPLSKRAKDYGSAAVLLTLLIAGLTWATAIAGLL